ncbi:MAG: MT-A70 family methyltransferase [Patescibacteria group bacterium]
MEIKELTNQKWYEELIEDCKSIMIEAVHNSRWDLIKGYYDLGMRILAENHNFEREKIYGNKIVQRVAQSLNLSHRSIFYTIQFVKKYPDIDKLPEGKNISWHKICNKYLPAPKENETEILLPEGTYQVILADPPWKYNNTGFEMSAENKYPTMSVDDILNEIKFKTTENAILFMWVTSPMLEEGLKLVNGWGFQYKTNFVWIKKNHTAGFYVFGQHELLLIAVKGNKMLPTGEKFKSIITGDNNKHSKKPESVYEIIEKMYPNHKYLELFARNTREKWESFGNEL